MIRSYQSNTMSTNRNQRWSLRKRNDSRCGVAATEMAMLAPFLVLILMAAVDVGQAVNVAQIVNDASREGARFASRADVTDSSQVEASVNNYLANAFPGGGSQLASSITVSVNDSVGTVPGGDLTSVDSGDPISVRVGFDFDSVRWTAWFAWLDGSTMTTTTVMRRE